MLSVPRLRVLAEFADRGSVAAAGAALGYTASAVSQHLAQLEREAGVALLRRSGRRLELTDAGRELLAHARDVLDRLERAEASLAAHAGEVRGTLRVAAFQLAAMRLAVPALSALAADHPALEVRFAEAEAEASLPLLLSGRVDLALVEEYEHAPRPRHERLDRIDLLPDDLLLALPQAHPLAEAAAPVSLAALRDAAWATAAPGTAYADMVVRLCRTAGGFEPRVLHRASDLRLLLDLVAGGHAVALVPALGDPAADPRVAIRPLAEGRFPRRIFAAVRSADRARPAVAAALDALAEAAERAHDGAARSVRALG